MEVINPCLAHLSAYETLELIRSLKTSQEKARTAFELEVEDVNSPQTFSHSDKLHHNPENIQELIYPFIQHFESSFLPQSRQTEKSIESLLEALRPFSQVGGRQNGLTKAERLQICDLAPTEAVDIYLIIEECDLRFTEPEVEAILSHIKSNLPTKRLITSVPKSNGKLSHTKNGEDLVNGDFFEDDYNMEPNLGDIDDDDALVAEAREGGPAPDQELDEVPD
ncbi:hypothetical protein CROQUDRAFT_650055 [Cronartium quercuum f. sp. fusiforme G11]|uniref:DNA-directed RNA polymerase III subunit RPC9 n=1 Tax=Cronartium quercuum f. sp. fusiforme G11 TaxID=708437 RepID=A0A9P6NUP6_9BASI|nr:hypothetical protein CROQUDRAFT_650055 [Cronartium quercuum f. sp. fusiforme G11]